MTTTMSMIAGITLDLLWISLQVLTIAQGVVEGSHQTLSDSDFLFLVFNVSKATLIITKTVIKPQRNHESFIAEVLFSGGDTIAALGLHGG